jgi:cytochrome c oxidase subunit 2
LLGLETAHSPNAEDISTAYWVMLVLAGVLIVAVNAALVMMLLRFRASRGVEPRRIRGRGRTQGRVAAAFAVLAVALFAFGVVVTREASDVQPSGPDGLAAANSLTAQRGLSLPEGGPDPLTIKAIGQQWIWRYEYPAPPEAGNPPASGTEETADTGTVQPSAQSFAEVFSYYELVVPVDTTVKLDIESTDVVHRWWVPELGGKFDAVPGRPNSAWFRADEEGVYDGQSAAYSGVSYATMRTRVRVVSPEEYQAWVGEQAADIEEAQAAVQEELATRVPTAADQGSGELPGSEPASQEDDQ